MVFFNYATMQMAAKIVYYGPGLCGKTTNLHWIYAKTTPQSRGEMVSLETETDRTLFFDLLPLDVGMIGGFKTRLQLYTIPGQVFYNTTRKLVLKGVDGLVFVADLQRAMLEANIESFKNLRENLSEIGLELDDLPLVIQLNKRDLPNVIEKEVLLAALDPAGKYNSVEAAAVSGEGVFETLKEISKLTLRTLRRRMMGEENRPPPRVSAPVPQPEAKPREVAVGFSPPAVARGIILGPAAAQVPVASAPSMEARDTSSAQETWVEQPATEIPLFDESPFPETDYEEPPLDEHGVIGPDDGFSEPAGLDHLPGEAEDERVDDLRETDDSQPLESEDYDEAPVPPIKRVKVRSTNEVMAELEALRKMATQTPPRTRRWTDSRKSRISLILDRPIPVDARLVRLAFSFEDAEGNVVQREEQSVNLEESHETDGFLIRVGIDVQK